MPRNSVILWFVRGLIAVALTATPSDLRAQQNPFILKEGSLEIDPGRIFKKRTPKTEEKVEGGSARSNDATSGWAIRSDGAICLIFSGQDSNLDLDNPARMQGLDPLLELCLKKQNPQLAPVANPLSFITLYRYARGSEEMTAEKLIQKSLQYSRLNNEFERKRMLESAAIREKIEALARPARAARAFVYGHLAKELPEYDFNRGGYLLIRPTSFTSGGVYALLDAQAAERLINEREARGAADNEYRRSSPVKPTFDFLRGSVGNMDIDEKALQNAVGINKAFYIQFEGPMSEKANWRDDYGRAVLNATSIRIFLVGFNNRATAITEWQELAIVDERRADGVLLSTRTTERTAPATVERLSQPQAPGPGANTSGAGPYSVRPDGALNFLFVDDPIRFDLKLALERCNPGLAPLSNSKELGYLLYRARNTNGSVDEVIKNSEAYRKASRDEFARRRILQDPVTRNAAEAKLAAARKPSRYFASEVIYQVPQYDFEKGGYRLGNLNYRIFAEVYALINAQEAEALRLERNAMQKKFPSPDLSGTPNLFPAATALYLQCEGPLPAELPEDWEPYQNADSFRVFLVKYDNRGKAITSWTELKILDDRKK